MTVQPYPMGVEVNEEDRVVNGEAKVKVKVRGVRGVRGENMVVRFPEDIDPMCCCRWIVHLVVVWVMWIRNEQGEEEV